jgi:hypothetical protein
MMSVELDEDVALAKILLLGWVRTHRPDWYISTVIRNDRRAVWFRKRMPGHLPVGFHTDPEVFVADDGVHANTAADALAYELKYGLLAHSESPAP